jgi:putative phosphoribosyl transferase
MFEDRWDAGQRLAEALVAAAATDRGERALVVGLARGGVTVAAAVATVLGGDLVALAVRKVAAPTDPEFALGAVAAGGGVVWNPEAVDGEPRPGSRLWTWSEAARQQAERLQAGYGADWLAVAAGRPAVIVDDGLATGLSALAAVRRLRAAHSGTVTVAVPVASVDARERLVREADRVVCVASPPTFRAVSEFYRHFGQVSEAEVRAALARAGRA